MRYAAIFIASILLLVSAGPIVFLYGIVVSRTTRTTAFYLHDISIGTDQLGSVLCQYLFNHLFVIGGGIKYGNPDETISSTTGRNYINNTLTRKGRLFRFLIDLVFGKNHCVNAIGI